MTSSSSEIGVQNFTREMFNSNDYQSVLDFLGLVKHGAPWSIDTELLLALNGNTKRGKYVIQTIDGLLRSQGLICTPSIENADYYGAVVVSDPRDRLPRRGEALSLPLSAFPSEFGGLIYFTKNAKVSKIKAKMVSYDISQIPILSNDLKHVLGVVTWRSLALAAEKAGDVSASEVMSPPGHVATSRDDFLDLVHTIIEQEYVLFRVPDGTVKGIVTASDLASAFNGTAGIYVRLQELESRIRVLLDRSSIPDLQQCLEPRRRDMAGFRGANDMMFGEYLSALKNEKVWKATGIEFDQETCLKLLEAAKDVRNGVMHFSSGDDGDNKSEGDPHNAVLRALRIMRAVPLP